MEQLDQKKETEKSSSLGWLERIFYALFSAPPIGLLLGLLLSMNTSGVDGEYGYAVLYNSAIMMGFAFFVLIFISNKRIQNILAAISAVVWVIALFNI